MRADGARDLEAPVTALPSRVLVVGLGRTGRAVARILRGRGAAVRAVDDRPRAQVALDPEEWRGIDLRFGGAGDADVGDVDLVVPSPGVPARAPVLRAAAARGVPVWSEIELAARLLSCPVVAVTGTNGKSTTTTLVGAALAGDGRATFVGGNLGRPLVEAVDEPCAVAVAEVSSFQLEWVETFRPAVAVILNVTPDHLDRHASFAEYRDLKGRIFDRQTAGDHAVVNRDDDQAAGLAARGAGSVATFGWSAGERGATIVPPVVRLDVGAGPEEYRLDRTALQGRANAENVAAAALVARLAGAAPPAVAEAIDRARPLPHRLELVREHRGVRWFDDSKATNVGAVVQSLGTFDRPVILIAGGVDKGGDYAPLVAAARRGTRLAVLIGEARARLGAALAPAGVRVEEAASLEAAVALAAGEARAGDVVVLAPACSSFDMFRDYTERGRRFRAAVEEVA
jgi:UDP-N-acetylmuramoylalanine--D-glutamate ligase